MKVPEIRKCQNMRLSESDLNMPESEIGRISKRLKESEECKCQNLKEPENKSFRINSMSAFRIVLEVWKSIFSQCIFVHKF